MQTQPIKHDTVTTESGADIHVKTWKDRKGYQVTTTIDRHDGQDPALVRWTDLNGVTIDGWIVTSSKEDAEHMHRVYLESARTA